MESGVWLPNDIGISCFRFDVDLKRGTVRHGKGENTLSSKIAAIIRLL